MPHSTEDIFFKDDKVGVGEGSNTRQEHAILVVDDEDTTFDAEFAALEDAIPSDILGECTMQGFEHDQEAESMDPQDSSLSDLRCQIFILSNTIRYIRHLELSTKRLQQEKAVLEAKKK
jgi:hypothetical protein